VAEILLRSESQSGKCAKLRTAAASNNRDHASLYYCLLGALTYAGLSMVMSFLWESHGKRPMGWDGAGRDTFVFPMRLRNRMGVSECYWIIILRLYFWIL